MLVKEAKDVVRQWVVEEGSTIAGFCGAYFCGTTNWMRDDAELPLTSDVDVAIVIDRADPPGRREKSLCKMSLWISPIVPAINFTRRIRC
jgi:hypothetical protein